MRRKTAVEFVTETLREPLARQVAYQAVGLEALYQRDRLVSAGGHSVFIAVERLFHAFPQSQALFSYAQEKLEAQICVYSSAVMVRNNPFWHNSRTVESVRFVLNKLDPSIETAQDIYRRMIQPVGAGNLSLEQELALCEIGPENMGEALRSYTRLLPGLVDEEVIGGLASTISGFAYNFRGLNPAGRDPRTLIVAVLGHLVYHQEMASGISLRSVYRRITHPHAKEAGLMPDAADVADYLVKIL